MIPLFCPDDSSSSKPRGKAAPKHNNEKSRSPRAHILIAEDNHVNQIVVKEIVRTLGYTFELVADGKQAVEAFRTGQYDLILMDCQMPEMDGYDAARAIRECESSRPGKTDDPPVPIIAITANSMDRVREKCLAAGMNDCCIKPINPRQLGDLIKALLERKSVRNPH